MKSNFSGQKVILCILDGWGISKYPSKSDAIYMAKTYNYDKIINKYPNTLLIASENQVGLPKKQFGNSEVGHMNIGAGRIINQDLLRINKSISSGELEKNDKLKKLKKKKRIHLIGLVSDGGVHGHIDHLLEIIKLLNTDNNELLIHCITDGRDSNPTDGIKHIENLNNLVNSQSNSRICSISGRYFSMDRDNRWERTELAYKAIIEGNTKKTFDDPVKIIEESYNDSLTDEFLEPVVNNNFDGSKNGDALLITNYRADRVRQLLTSLVDDKFLFFKRKKIVNFSHKLGLTQYSKRLSRNIDWLFGPNSVDNTLGKILSNEGLDQLRIAETEKYAHVTYFFNGGAEEKYRGEDRILIPSPRVKTYDVIPEMSCFHLTNEVIKNIKKNHYEFILINFANPDMVGHTGNLSATIKAVQAVDDCLGQIYKVCNENRYTLVITSDHGNADLMQNKENNSICTTHSLNPVPFMICSKKKLTLRKGILADIAPTILEIMDIKKPSEMSGRSIIIP